MTIEIKKIKIKDIIESFADICNAIEEGEIDAIPEYQKIVWLLDELTEFKSQMLDYALTESDLFNKDELKGMGLEVMQPDRYNYTENPLWVQKNAELKEIEKEMKISYKNIVDGKQNTCIPAIHTTTKRYLKRIRKIQ